MRPCDRDLSAWNALQIILTIQNLYGKFELRGQMDFAS